MDQESVQSGRSEKSERTHARNSQVQLQPMSATSSDTHQHMNYPLNASVGCMYPNDPSRNISEMQARGLQIPQQPMYPTHVNAQQHTPFVANWNGGSPPLNAPYLPYSPPGMYQPQQCMNIMGWSGPPIANCPPGAAYPMHQLPQTVQSFHPKQPSQPLLPIDAGNVQKHGPLSSGQTPTSSHRGGNQQIEQYCSNDHDENAWVENATAVTGATSETGLSADNMSRYGARYGLLASLGLDSGPNSCISGAAAALIRTEIDEFQTHACAHVFGLIVYFGLGLCSIFSPILMVVFPYLPSVGWVTDTCEPTCEGYLIGMAVKLALLCLGTWILTAPHCPMFKQGRTILPHVRLWRSLFLCLIFVVLFAFWLFYCVRIIQPKEKAYGSIVLFSNSLADTLLFLNFAGIALMEFQRMRSHFAVHVVRSPDGSSKTYRISEMSLQKAAQEVLQHYMIDFTVYTQPSSSSGSRRSKRGASVTAEGGGVGNDGGSMYKFYDVDGRGGGGGGGGGGGPGGGEKSGGTTGHLGPSASARLYDEMETEKRVRKRRMRLLLAVEDAFAHANRMAKETGDNGVGINANLSRGSTASDRIGMTPYHHNGNGNLRMTRDQFGPTDTKKFDAFEAAQTVFPTLIRPLQKYMRATRQQSRHPVDSVIDHLAVCFTYRLSPLTFLERFNPAASTPQQDAATAASALTVARSISQRHRRPLTIAGPISTDADGNAYKPPNSVARGGQQVWQIIADRALSRDLADGVVFQLKRRHGNCDISLLCTVRRLPLLQLFESGLDTLQQGTAAFTSSHARVVA